MLSKEEIENSFTKIEIICKQEVCLFNQTIIEGNLNQIKRYIIQLESDKQKLIEKLEEDIENANNNIKHMEEKSILQTIARELAVGMRDYAQEILEIVKGENNGRK